MSECVLIDVSILVCNEHAEYVQYSLHPLRHGNPKMVESVNFLLDCQYTVITKLVLH